MERNFAQELKAIMSSDIPADQMREALEHYHKSDIADAIQALSKEEREHLYSLLDDELVSEIFSYIDDVEEYIEELPIDKAADIIELMDVDDAIDVLEELDEDKTEQIMELMDAESQADIKLINSYTDEEVGSLITTNFIVIPKNFTIKQAMRHLINEAATCDNVSTLYVVDENNKFYGTISLRDLIIARENSLLEDVIKKSYPYLYDTDLISDVINSIKEYSLDSIPVLNHKKEIIGVITNDDVMETVDEQHNEDYAKLGGLSESEDLEEGVFDSVKKRMPWLLILLFLGLTVSVLISTFENVVKVLPMIVFFQSLILGMAGNVGTQSLAVTIRILTDEKIDKKLLIKAILKEIRVGFMNGLLLGTISALVVMLFLYIDQTEIILGESYRFIDSLKVAFCVACSMLGAMTLSSFIGSSVPILLKKLRIDPAVASGPFITTINDMVAILLYYGLAYIIFILML